ncbi:hypothetical protein OG203_31000 [Nocardia sp. NBC_01499]|uniref:hypothetical protein n=1 Tax=Nocardia sp. NBC_01499 TaxID=2903597 RepID=UPI00386AC3BA
MPFVELTDPSNPAPSTLWAQLATTATLPMQRNPVSEAVEAASWFCKHWNVHQDAPLIKNTMRLIVTEVVNRCWFEHQPWLRAQAINVRIRWSDINTLVIEAWDTPPDQPLHDAPCLRYRLFQTTRLRVGHG